jgi:hypothetical protein
VSCIAVIHPRLGILRPLSFFHEMHSGSAVDFVLHLRRVDIMSLAFDSLIDVCSKGSKRNDIIVRTNVTQKPVSARNENSFTLSIDLGL